jgi:hypothetical protein
VIAARLVSSRKTEDALSRFTPTQQHHPLHPNIDDFVKYIYTLFQASKEILNTHN